MKTVALLAAFALVVLLVGGKTQSQQLSTDVFPSEDEIHQALQSGEIDYQQYLILMELAAHGVDSSNAHLLDQIPNLTFFQLKPDSLRSALEQEQLSAFVEKPEKTEAKRASGLLSHRYYQYLEETGSAKYQSTFRMDYGKRVRLDVQLRREYTGYERVTGRTLTYKNKQGTVRRLAVGSFSDRIGLGTVFGYRGKILDYSREIDMESWLYPDYGGYNGVSAQLSGGGWDAHGLVSYTRDENYRIGSVGGMFRLTGLPLNPGVIVGVNRLTQRESGVALDDMKYGLNIRQDYRGGYSALEASVQAGDRQSFGAVVTEGRYRFERAEMRYAGWYYDDGYIDLTGGSKAGSISRREEFDDIDFGYSSKRSGQHGGLVKTAAGFLERMRLATSVLYASFNADTSNIEWLTELSRKQGSLTLSVEFLSRYKKRYQLDDNYATIKRQTRFVVRLRNTKLYVRTYAGYTSQAGENDLLSVFAGIRYKHDSFGRLEVWSNLSEINHRQGRINYWYAYLKNSFHTIGNLTAGIKLSHTYSRGSKASHRSVVSFDLAYAF